MNFQSIFRKLLGLPTLNLFMGLLTAVAVIGLGSGAVASSTSNAQQTINAGTLAVDIVDGSYVTVGSPSVVFGAVTFGFSCKTGANRGAGTLGTASQQIYVSNPD